MRNALPLALWPFLAALGIVIGWWGAILRHNSQSATMHRQSEVIEQPVIRRPAEFGPISLSREHVDRIRDAIIEDQLGARKESPKQRRQRMARYRGWTDRQRVQHWLLHWREDYVYALTGAGWASV